MPSLLPTKPPGRAVKAQGEAHVQRSSHCSHTVWNSANRRAAFSIASRAVLPQPPACHHIITHPNGPGRPHRLPLPMSNENECSNRFGPVWLVTKLYVTVSEVSCKWNGGKIGGVLGIMAIRGYEAL